MGPLETKAIRPFPRGCFSKSKFFPPKLPGIKTFVLKFFFGEVLGIYKCFIRGRWCQVLKADCRAIKCV